MEKVKSNPLIVRISTANEQKESIELKNSKFSINDFYVIKYILSSLSADPLLLPVWQSSFRHGSTAAEKQIAIHYSDKGPSMNTQYCNEKNAAAEATAFVKS